MFNPLHVDPLLVSTKACVPGFYTKWILFLTWLETSPSTQSIVFVVVLDLSFLLLKAITGGSMGRYEHQCWARNPRKIPGWKVIGNTGAMWMNNPWKSPVLSPKQSHKLPETACELRFHFANVYILCEAIFLKSWFNITLLCFFKNVAVFY